MNLLDETLKLLNSTSVPYEKIAKELNVSTRYVYRLSKGEFKDPGVNKIQKLYWFLREAEMTAKPEHNAAA